ncbi:MAG: divalent-cation tolerance protein CutA [Candidatus Lokiarchaeota archaeon]|nr:divalent-cation tolerance protein CutA [Candidatus Lokiarchaeota archaeon]
MIFFVTTPDNKTAVELANGIVQRKIAACTNIIHKITSIYWWEGKINTDSENLMIIKTSKKKSDDLIAFIKNNHPYKVPECIGIKITKGLQPYLQWIMDLTTER